MTTEQSGFIETKTDLIYVAGAAMGWLVLFTFFYGVNSPEYSVAASKDTLLALSLGVVLAIGSMYAYFMNPRRLEVSS